MEKIKQATDYKKFIHEKVKIIVLRTKYFIINECIQGFKSLGHKVLDIKISSEDTFLKELLFSICEFKPDFIFAVNHLGFDTEGKLTQILTEIKMPFAIWYVDSPTYILKEYGTKNVSDFAYIFVWDKYYIKELKSIGFDNVHYLPLATNPNIFKPIEGVYPKYISKVSFVGDSMINPVQKWKNKIGEIPHLDDISSFAYNILKKELKPIKEVVSEIISKFELNISPDKMIDFESYINLVTTMEYRKEYLKNLSPLRIYGDEGWENYHIPNLELYPTVNYYKELPFVYNGSDININLTSFQMPYSCNQRVFDVPATGNFLITDYREALNDIFDVQKDISIFYNKEELQSLVKYYLNHKQEREKKSRSAMKKILSNHTYLHRLKELIKNMQKIYSS